MDEKKIKDILTIHQEQAKKIDTLATVVIELATTLKERSNLKIMGLEVILRSEPQEEKGQEKK